MRLDTSNKSIAVGAQGTFWMTARKKTYLTADGSGSGLGAYFDLFGFAQFAVWANLSEEMVHNPVTLSRGFLFCSRIKKINKK